MMAMLELKKGDEVWVYVEVRPTANTNQAVYDDSHRYTHFIGHLLFV